MRRGRPERAACRPTEVRAGSSRWPSSSIAVQRDGRPPPGERRDRSGATATGAATSWPTSRTSCGRRSPRCARSTSCSRSMPATTRRPAPSSSSRAASRSNASTGSPRTCSSSRSWTPGLVLLDLRPDDLRAAVESAVEQHARRPRAAAASTLSAGPARRAGADPARPAADRPGRRQPHRQRDQVHAARRLGHASTIAATTDGGAAIRWPTRGSGSIRPSCPTSSSGSTAARGPTRPAAAAAAWAWPSSSRSSRCTAGGSPSRAGSGRDRGSR